MDTPKTEITIPNEMKLAEAAKIALKKIKLELELIGVQVSEDIENYKPRLAKKNGKAKTDMPCNIKIMQVSITITVYFKSK